MLCMYSKPSSKKLTTYVFMDKDDSQVSSLVYTLYAFTSGIRMEFRLKRCEDLVLKGSNIKWIEDTIKRAYEVDKRDDQYFGY